VVLFLLGMLLLVFADPHLSELRRSLDAEAESIGQLQGGAIPKCNYNLEGQKCFYGSIFFQNCAGNYLTVMKPSQRLEWRRAAESKSCFWLRKPLSGEQFFDGRYLCSIESTVYPEHYWRINDRGELVMDPKSGKTKVDEFTFLIDRGVNGVFHTVSIRRLDGSCLFDDGKGIGASKKNCGIDDESKNSASFYIGQGLDDYDWWFKKYSLFNYNTLTPSYPVQAFGDSIAVSNVKK